MHINKFLVTGVFSAVLALVLLSGIMNTGYAQQSSDIINVSVTVRQKTIIDITPTSLTWTDVDPGSEAGASNETNGWGSIQIENLGSTNISYVWFNNSYPASRPFGTGANGSYDAGNFVVIKRNWTGTVYYFPNRFEYNASKTIIYVTVPSGWWYGRFRNASWEYFWAVNASKYPSCNQTGTEFRIGIYAHNKTSQGSTDLTDPTQYREYSLTNDGSWGYAAVNVSPDNTSYCVAVANTCDRAMFYHWNMDAPGAGSCANAEYFSDSTLTPGDWLIADVLVRVPYGVAYGQVQTGQLTVIAQV
ncbi:MAG: hypothetical protein DRP16_04705 [Candidatus Aenigmatarchaeota archaeon]|nr:MAG: hypothetical protein DRP16_04705 [Candidatus Aenigmarchaeota archaeon]